MNYYIDLLLRTLATVGALNWGLIGAFEFNLVTFLFNDLTIVQAIYIIVGLAGLYQLYRIIRLLLTEAE